MNKRIVMKEVGALLIVVVMILSSLSVSGSFLNPPNKPSKPVGPKTGDAGIEYTYLTSAIDPDGDPIYLWWDWDDGTSGSWDGPFISGESVTASHTWSSDGIYCIKVKAKDNTGESGWSDELCVTMGNGGNNKPTVKILYPLDGDIVESAIIISGTASDPDGNQELQKVEIKIDSDAWSNANGLTSWTYDWDTASVNNGLHKISARSFDGQVHSDIDQITVTVNNIAHIDWPMFQHDISNSGYTISTAPDTNNVKWSAGSPVSCSSPAIVNGKVYVGFDNGTVGCFNAETGTHIWSYTIGGKIDSSPTVYDGKIYIGTGLQSNVHNIYCLNADTGAHIWDFPTGGAIMSSPCVHDGYVYIGSQDKNIYCLRADNGNKKWNYTLSHKIDYSSPCIDNLGRLYITSFSGLDGAVTYCFDKANGNLIWERSMISQYVSHSPTLYDGRVYIATRNFWIYCFSNTGFRNWYEAIGSNDFFSSPAILGGKIYIGCMDSKMYCVNANTGQTIWEKTINNVQQSSPAIADGKVYVGAIGGLVYCLDKNNGDILWTYQTKANILNSPAVADGRLYIGSDKLYCFEDTDNNPPTPPVITGQSSGKAGTSYSYNFVSTDPDNDQVEYYIMWGDGDITSWTGLQSQGFPGCDESHIWDTQDTYLIEAKARDEHGLESDWGTFSVIMPKNKQYINTPFMNFLEKFLENHPNMLLMLKLILKLSIYNP